MNEQTKSVLKEFLLRFRAMEQTIQDAPGLREEYQKNLVEIKDQVDKDIDEQLLLILSQL